MTATMKSLFDQFSAKMMTAVSMKVVAKRTADEYVSISRHLCDGIITTDSIRSKERFLQIAAVLRKMKIFGLIRDDETFGLNIPELKDRFKKSAGTNVKIARIENKYVSKEQLQAFCDACANTSSGRQLKLAARISHGCGARMDEVLHLKRDDFEVQEKTICVKIRNGKGGKPRKTYLKTDDFVGDVATFAPFTITRHALNSISVRTFKKIGLHTSFHAFRHSFATDAAKRGVSLLELAAMLGHSDPKTTMQYYRVNETASEAMLLFLNNR